MLNDIEIEKIEKGKYVILKLKGRIAADSSLRLSEAIDAEIKSGAGNIILDIADVDYISSAGVRVLLISYKQLYNLNGSFSLYRPNNAIKSLISIMNLPELADSSKFELAMGGGQTAPDYGTFNGLDIDVLFRSASVSNVKIVGNIDKTNDFSYSAEDMRRLENSPKTIAVGLGAFDTDVKPMIERAGEFISIGGFAAFMPSDGSRKPDFLVAMNGRMPDVNYLYCATGECDYSAAFTFKNAGTNAPVKFGDIVKTAHAVAGCDNILMVVTGEIAGIVGSSLAVPPGINRKKTPDNFRAAIAQIKEKYVLTGERAYAGHIALCAGVSCASPDRSSDVAKFIKPLARGSILSGHFHAAVFESMSTAPSSFISKD
ncbi:MAG TPA: STAS domain-containing protein, partial [Candidatus Wallbacteria bacterium]|nr:STAS domain-containing protein [Candidatus Wallbacteria bacterium]